MHFLARLRALWHRLIHPGRAERELDEELRSYVDLLADEYERPGLPTDRARRAALASAGGVAQVVELTREAWTGHAMIRLGREARDAIRSLRRSPAFVIVAIATLAIGIGGATAIFTVVTGSLLRPLAGVADPGALVTVERLESGRQIAEFSYPDYRDLRDRSTTLAGLAAFNGTSMTLAAAFGSTRAWVSYVSDDFFDVLGTQPTLGRLFHGDRSARSPAAIDVAVLGYDLWQERFGGSPSAVGSVIRLQGHAFTVVGVAPRGFIGAMRPYPMDLWIPLAAGSPPLQDEDAGGTSLTSRRMGWLRLVGRLAPGRRVGDAQQELSNVSAVLAAAYPTNRARGVRVLAGAGMAADERESFSHVPLLLALAVGVLLLIACGNVAGLMLVRADARRRELVTRLALGAPRAALVRQVAVEGMLIGIGAGAAGVLLARALVDLPQIVSTVVPLPDPDLSLSLPVLALAAGGSMATAVLVSILPAFHATRIAAREILNARGSTSSRRGRGQRGLVAAQVAASLVLLAAATMIASAFHRVLAAEDEADPKGLSDAFVEVSASLHDQARTIAFYRALLTRAAAEPGVLAAALTSTIPPFQWADHATVFRRGEEPPTSALVGHELDLGYRVSAVVISEDFFRLMRIPVLNGRAFTARDDGSSDPVAIVGKRLADLLWPGRDPIGRFIAWPAVEGPRRPPVEVVGVVADTRDLSTDVPPLAMYVPLAQQPGRNLGLTLRLADDRPFLPADFVRLGASVDPNVRIAGAPTLFDRLRDETQPQRTASAWIAVFGAIALLLAAVGLYGVVSQRVSQRRRELAMRSALGAAPRDILVLVLMDGVRLAALGALTGALGAGAMLRFLTSVYGRVGVADAPAALAAFGVLALVLLVASAVPACRAAAADPVRVLNSES